MLIKGGLFQVPNTYFEAAVLNYVCFLFRIKIPIIAVCGDAFAHRTFEESGVDKTLLDGLGDL